MKKMKLYSGVLFWSFFMLAFTDSTFSQDKKAETIKIKTSAVCGQCKERIESGMAFQKGVKDVNLDVETKIATITFNTLKTNPDLLRKAISKLGYDADSVVADSAAYVKLPACCKKNAAKH
jgi:periplasmic mercuric ion binding protein